MHGLAAGLGHGGPLPFFLTHFVDLAAQRRHPLVEGGQRRLLLPQQGGAHPLKEPGIAQRPPSDHHPVAAGFFQHGQGAFGGGDVAVGQHRDGHRFLDLGNGLSVDGRNIHLLPGSAMHRDEVGAVFLAPPGHLHTGEMFRVPANAHLDGQRHLRADGFPGGLDHLPAEEGIQHQLAARSAGGNFGCRTAHVNVQNIIADPLFGQNADGTPQRGGIRPKQLDCVQPVGVGVSQQGQAFLVAKGNGLGAGHLADRPGRTVFCHQMPACRIGQTGHGSEHRPHRNGFAS